MTLTTLGIERYPKPAARVEIPDDKTKGLFLVAQPSGSKAWAVRYRAAGRSRKLTLGGWPTIGLADARKLAAAILLRVAAGDDPAGEKSEQRRKVQAGVGEEQQFSDAWDRYVTEYVRPTLKPRTAHELERVGRTLIVPKFGRRRLKEIQAFDIKAICDDQIKRGSPTQAQKVFVTLRGFFNWTVEHVILEKSPCDGLKVPKGSEARERVLSDQELIWLWRASGEIGYPFGPFYRILLLTGARRGEIAGLREREINKTTRLITLPGARTKNGREHAIYLNSIARDVLADIPRLRENGGFVFTTTGETAISGWSRAKSILDTTMAKYAKQADAEIAPWVIHDLRRTVASGMARIGVALPVIERCLNHVSGSFAGIVGVYQRHEFEPEKEAAFRAWGDHLARLIYKSV